MKNKLTITAILFLLSTAMFSQNKRDKEWIEDIDYIVSRIEITHPDMYVNISEKEFKVATSQLLTKVPSLSDSEVVLGIMELIASIKDDHTGFVFYESNADLMNKYLHSFPFTIYPFSDGLYIIAATKEYEKSVGKKVISIGKYSAGEAVKRVSKMISADNEYGTLSTLPFILNVAEILKYYDINNSLSGLNLELENEKGEREIISFKSKPIMTTLQAVFRGFIPTTSDEQLITMNKNSPNQTPLWFQHSNENYWFKYLKDKNTYYLQINKNYIKNDENFTDFINRMFKEFDKNKAEKLIIDIRLNDGGQHIEMPLLKGIIARPKLDKPENLFLLTSRIVASASQHLTSRIEFNTNVTIIGEPTGSKPNFFGSPKRFSPPNNKDLVYRTSSAFFQDAIPQDFRLSTKPDFLVPYNSIHYKNNLDPVLEKVFDYEKYNKRYLYYQDKLQKAFTNKGLKGLKTEYQNLKNEIIETGLDMEEVFLTSFDLWIMRNTKTDDEYIEYLEFIVEEFPKCSTAWYWLADWVKEKKGTPEKAKEYYQKCLILNPENHLARMDYKLLLLEQKN